MATRVAVVTGSNKGIGFGIVEGLCKSFKGDVYLTARDVSRGHAAVAKLQAAGYNPLFHQLDVTEPDSIKALRDFLKEKYGGLDLLVNNAAIAFKSAATEPLLEQAEQTTFVNYFSLVSTCNILFPLLRSKARVVNLSSSAGHLSRIPSESLRKRFGDVKLTESDLSDIVKEFIASVKNGKNVEDGWGNSTYVVSKVAVSALTFIQNRELGPKDISVNCVHPGYVDTDMTSHQGHLTIEQGSAAALYLSLDAPDSLKGVYMWHDKSIVDWYGTPPGMY